MNAEEKIKKAYASILGHDFEQAIEWFEEAIEDEPDNAAYHYKLSITYARSNKLTQALKHAQMACSLNEQEEYCFHLQHLQSKELLFKAEKYFDQTEVHLREAVSLLEKAISLDPISLEAYLLKGMAYAELLEYDRAIKAIEEVMILDPQHSIGEKLLKEYKNLQTLHLRKGKVH